MLFTGFVDRVTATSVTWRNRKQRDSAARLFKEGAIDDRVSPKIRVGPSMLAGYWRCSRVGWEVW